MSPRGETALLLAAAVDMASNPEPCAPMMDAPVEAIGAARGGYNISGCSFTATELAEAVGARVPGFTCDFLPDVRQKYADSWPDSVDDQAAQADWGWAAEYDLDAMCDAMFAGLQSSSI